MVGIEEQGLKIEQVRDFSCAAELTRFLTTEAVAVRSMRGGRDPLHSKGMTLFELVVVICIVGILASVLLGRVLYYQEQAEKTVMVNVAGVIQTALILQYGEILTRGKNSDIEWLKNDNPMNWLQQKPLNYAGEFDEPNTQLVEPGNWFFDRKSHDLIYVLNLTNNFKQGKDGKNWIRYHVSIKYEPSRLPSLQNAPAELTGVQFEPVESYLWF